MGIGDAGLGIAAVQGVAGELRPVAEVFQMHPAVWTSATGVAEPRHSHPHAHLKASHARPYLGDTADDFVARDQRQFRRRQLAIDHMQIGAADAAGRNVDADLARARRWLRDVLQG